MIKFVRFVAHNLLWYDNVDISLNNQGLVFISGKNGVGKSLLFDAMQDAIFKTTPRGLRKGDVAGKDAFYTLLRVRINETKYDIEFFRNHEKHKNGYRITKDGEPDTPHGIPACERYIRQIFGLSDHEWSTIYYSQRSLSTLVEGSNSERQAYLDRLFNIVQYDELISRVKDELKVLSAKTEDVASLRVVLEDAKQELANLPLLTDLKKSREDAKIKLTKATSYIEDARAECKKYERMLADNKHRQTLVAALAEEPETESSDALRKQIKETRAKLSVLIESKTLATKKAKYQNQLDALVKPKKTSAKLKTSLETTLAERDSIQALIKTIVKRDRVLASMEKIEKPSVSLKEAKLKREQALDTRSEITTKIAMLKDRLEKMDALVGATCPTCDAPLDQDNLEKHREEISNELELLGSGLKLSQLLVKEMALHIENHALLDEKITELKHYETKESHEDTLASLDGCETVIKKLRSDLENAEAWESLDSKLSEIDVQESVDTLTNNISKLEYVSSRLGDQLSIAIERESLSRQLAELKEIDEDAVTAKLDASERAYEIASSDVDNIKNTISEFNHKIIETEKAAEKVTRIEAQLEKFKEAQNRIYLLDNVHKAFKKLKQMRRHLVLQTLIRHLQQYAALLFDKDAGISFGLSEDEDSVSFLCTQKESPPYDIRTMSGGEKSRVTLALLFTLPLLVAPRKRSNMLILDEVDSALDAEGKEMLTTSVFPSLRSLFGTIFVISHNNDVNINSFDQIWQIVKKDGVSSIIKTQSGNNT